MSVPLDSTKYESAPFFNPSDFIAYIRALGRLGDSTPPEAVILSYQRSLFEHVCERHSVSAPEGYFANELRYLGGTGGKIAIAGRFGVGAPAAAVMLEELIAFGARRFVSVGTAGSLQTDIEPGSLVLCDAAFRDEGTSLPLHPRGRARSALRSPDGTTRRGPVPPRPRLSKRPGLDHGRDLPRDAGRGREAPGTGGPRRRNGGGRPLRGGSLPGREHSRLLQRERHSRRAELEARVPRRDHGGRARIPVRRRHGSPAGLTRTSRKKNRAEVKGLSSWARRG